NSGFVEFALATTPMRRNHMKFHSEPGAFMNETLPSAFGSAGQLTPFPSPVPAGLPYTSFSRCELNAIFFLYGTKVAAGEWRDYFIDFFKDKAVFSVFL